MGYESKWCQLWGLDDLDCWLGAGEQLDWCVEWVFEYDEYAGAG